MKLVSLSLIFISLFYGFIFLVIQVTYQNKTKKMCNKFSENNYSMKKIVQMNNHTYQASIRYIWQSNIENLCKHNNNTCPLESPIINEGARPLKKLKLTPKKKPNYHEFPKAMCCHDVLH